MRIKHRIVTMYCKIHKTVLNLCYNFHSSVSGLKPDDHNNEISVLSKESPIEVVDMKSRNPTLHSPLYLVSLNNKTNLYNIRSITVVNNIGTR